MSGAQIWLTILGGLIAGLVGLGLYFVQHRINARDAKKAAESEALREFAEALMPLLIELDRWRYNPDQTAVWVGASRQLPNLGTWIFDPEENARKPPDWDAIGKHSQAVERLWRDRLSARVADPEINEKWAQTSQLLFHLTRPDGANVRSAAEQAEESLLDLLDSIRDRTR